MTIERFFKRFLAAAGVVTLAAGSAMAQPANDLCANATPVAGPGVHAFTTFDATSDSVAGSTFCSPGGRPGVWFRYTPASTGLATLNVCGVPYATFLAVYDDCTTVRQWACHGTVPSDCAPFVTPITAGVDVYVLVVCRDPMLAGPGTLTITEATPTPPANDLCAGALAVGEGSTSFSTQNGTTQTGATCNALAGPDVWFVYTPPQDCIARFTTALNFQLLKPALSIFDECGGTELFCNSGDPNESYSRLTVPLTGGEDYFIRYSAIGAYFRSDTLTIERFPTVTNDTCLSAVPVTEGTFGPYSTVGATTDISSNCPFGQATSADIFFAYTASLSGFAFADLATAVNGWTLAAYDGCAGTLLDCNGTTSTQHGTVFFAVTANQTYILRVACRGTFRGSNSIRIAAFPPAANDTCSGASPVTTGSYPFDTNIAPGNDGSASCASSASSHDLWYRYDAAAAGTLVLDVINTEPMDPVVSVFDGCGGTEIACNDDLLIPATPGNGYIQSHLALPIAAGSSYWIRVASKDDGDENNDGPGAGRLDVAFYPPPINDLCANAITLTDGITPVSTWGATVDGVSVCGQGRHDVWFQYTASGSGIAVIDTCATQGSPLSKLFETTLSVYDGCNGTELACNRGDCFQFADLLFARVYRSVTAGQQLTIRLSGSDNDALLAGANKGQGEAKLRIQIVQPPADCVTPPVGSVLENETCGQTPDPNGGCSPGSAGYQDIAALPASIYGSFYAYNLVRDQDWYRFTLAQHKVVTLSLSAELTSRVSLFRGDCPPFSNSGDPTDIPSVASAEADTCGSGSVSVLLDAGTYVAHVFAYDLVGRPCAFGFNYVVSVAAEPVGACCLGAQHDCALKTADQCAAAGGVYRGNDTACGIVSQISATFEDISTTGTLMFDTYDPVVVQIGFPFTYYGNTYTQLTAMPYGYAAFSAPLFGNIAPLPSTSFPNNIIAPMWSLVGPFLVDPPGGLYYRRDGVAPNRRFVLSYQNVPRFVAEPPDSNSFQLMLFEGSNKIQFRYGAITAEPVPNEYSIGVENSTGTAGISIPTTAVGSGNISFEFDFSRGPCVCFADFNANGQVTIDDLFLYFNAYFMGLPGANTNGVGGVTIDDLFLYINAYFTGC